MFHSTTRAGAPALAASAVFAVGGTERRNEHTAGWAVLALSCVAALLYLRPELASLSSRNVVQDDESLDFAQWGIRHNVGSGQYNAISWGDLREVTVMTTDDSDDDDNMFIVLRGGDDNGIVVPHVLAVESGLLVELHRRLRGFDDNAFIAAIASHTNSVFLLWRSGTHGSVSPARGWMADLNQTKVAI